MGIFALAIIAPEGSKTTPQIVPWPEDGLGLWALQLVETNGGVPKFARTMCLVHEVRMQSKQRPKELAIFKEPPSVRDQRLGPAQCLDGGTEGWLPKRGITRQCAGRK